MNTTEIKNKTIPFKVKVLQMARLVIACLVRFFCRMYYGTEGEKIPPITEDILKMPAIEVAKKIRNKEVCNIIIVTSVIYFFVSRYIPTR